MLFYFRLMYGSRWPVDVSGATSLVLLCFVFRENKDVCVRERRVQFSDEFNLIHREPNFSLIESRVLHSSKAGCLTHREPGISLIESRVQLSVQGGMI